MRTFGGGNNNKKGPALSIVALIQGLIVIFALIILVSIVLAVLVWGFAWQTNVRLLTVLVHACIIGGAIWAGRRCPRKAWLHGVVVGAIAFLILSWMGENQLLFVTWLWWKRLIRLCLMTTLGGILGGLTHP